MIQQCYACCARYPLEQILYNCTECGGVLEIHVEAETCRGVELTGNGVWRYAPFLPVSSQHAVSMAEGDTGLHACERLGAELGIDGLFLKNEGENPTGSFKDRGMTIGVTKAVELDAQAVACASTGNTSASMAAYAARAGLRAIVLLPAGKVAMGKIAQAIVYGADIIQIEGNFDDAMRLVRELSLARGDVYLLNSINPFRLEGQKTLAFEICESLGSVPDAVVLPMGNAGNISAIWKGFCEFQEAGFIDRLPKMIGVQSEGACPIVRYLNDHSEQCRQADPHTIASAICIGAPVNWMKAVAAVQESGGTAGVVTDEEIVTAQRDLARSEGRFVEPASAAPIAYLRRYGLDEACVVCVATGHGLKDPDIILRESASMKRADATMEGLRGALELS
jgi:threonine synthase